MVWSEKPVARLGLFPLRYRDPRTGKWIRARYVAEQHEIEARYTEFELIGPPEIREIEPGGRYFTPFADQASRRELPLDMQPGLRAIERFRACVFLRRYVTYCARRRRYAAMNGAARLFREVCVR